MFAGEGSERLCRERKMMNVWQRKEMGTRKKYTKNEMKRDEKEPSHGCGDGP